LHKLPDAKVWQLIKYFYMKNFFVILLYFILQASIAQEMTLGWQNCFGANNTYSNAEALEVLPNGHLVVVIGIEGDNPAFTNYHGEYESWILELDLLGNIVNDKCIGGSENDLFHDIELYEDWIYFYGSTKSTDGDAQSPQIGGLNDLWVVKTDLELNIVWERKYGNLGPIQPIVAKATSSGGLVFAAEFNTQGGGDVSNFYGIQDIWVCKIDAEGDIIWETTLGNQNYNILGDLIIKENGHVVVLGGTDATGGMIECNFHGEYNQNLWITELNMEGEMLWQECYGGSKHEQGFDIIKEGNGYTILGVTSSNDGDVSGNHGWDSSDIWLYQIDSIGNLNWQKCFGGADHENGLSIFKTQSNGYVLIGISDSNDGDVTHNHCWPSGTCKLDPWIVVIDSARNILWENTFGGLQNGTMSRNSAVQIGEMDFVVTSQKYDEYEEYGGITSDFDCTPYPIENEYSAWIFRLYDPDMGIDFENELYETITVFPNPTQNKISVKLPTEIFESVPVKLIDLQGVVLIETIIIPRKSEMSIKGIKPGIYFIQLYFQERWITKKIVVQ